MPDSKAPVAIEEEGEEEEGEEGRRRGRRRGRRWGREGGGVTHCCANNLCTSEINFTNIQVHVCSSQKQLSDF